MKWGFIPAIVALIALKQPPPETVDDRQVEMASVYIESNININENPCENFQEYACGYFGINSVYDIFFGHTTNDSTHGKRYANVDNILLEMLTSTEPNVQTIEKAKDLFGKCMDEDTIQNEGDMVLVAELKRVGFGEILSPYLLVNGPLTHTFDYMKAWANLLKHPTLFDNFFGFRVNVMEDLQNKGSYVPLIVTNPDDQIVIEFDDDEAVTNILKYQLFRPAIIDADEDETLSKIITRYQLFRSRLKKIMEESESVDESVITWHKGYTRTTLAELQNETDKWMADMQFSNKYSDLTYNKNFTIDWSKFFTELFAEVPNETASGQRIDKRATLKNSSEFVIYVSDKLKLKNLVELLAKTEKKTFVMALWLATVMNTISMGPPQFQTTKIRTFNIQTRERICLAIIKDTFRPVVAHKLLQYVKEDDKIAISEMVANLKNSFLNVVHDVDWLMESAKDHIYKRIETLEIHIPYILTPRKPEALEDIYNEVDIRNSMTFYDAYSQTLRIKRKKEFSRIFYPNPQQSRLEYRPPVDIFSNAEVVKYYQLSNEIEISLIALGRPYYYGSNNELVPINLGALGFHLVRQMVHALGDVTAKIIRDKPTYQWTNEEESKFRERIIYATRLVSRSENYRMEDDTKRWKISQLEAAADNISWNVCFRALYGNYPESDNNPTGIGGSIQTASKIRDNPILGEYFTLGLAMTMCRTDEPPKTTYVNYHDRVNEILKHWKYFQFVWKCYEYDTPMIKLEPGEGKISIFSNDKLEN